MKRPAPQLVQWLEHFNQVKTELEHSGFKPTAVNAREGLATLTYSLVTERPNIEWIQDDLVKTAVYDVPVRIYHPEPGTRLPVLVYFHGGGHIAGSVSVYDAICRKITQAAHYIVVAVEYRLAPECPFPAAIVDAIGVVKNVWTTLEDRNLAYDRRLSIGGDSGGGALCATVAHLAQHDAGLGIDRQVLIYPSLDYTMGWPSIEENGRGYLLEKERIQWYFDNYFHHAENRRAASPLHMDVSRRLPETLVLTAEFCPLRDEGKAYVKKLKEAGVPVEHRHYNEMIHAFLNMENLVKETCEDAYREIGAFLTKDLSAR